MVTSTDVLRGKPDPEPYLKAAVALRFPSADCIVVEDAPAGIRAGKTAGARVIGFPTTMPELELKTAGADWILRDCSAIEIAHRSSPNGDLTLRLNTNRKFGPA
jgi:beta-phosphoglucomutase-like phosphatase (HAD superfamily)